MTSVEAPGVGEVFEEIKANTDGIEDFLPRELWKDYMLS